MNVYRCFLIHLSNMFYWCFLINVSSPKTYRWFLIDVSRVPFTGWQEMIQTWLWCTALMCGIVLDQSFNAFCIPSSIVNCWAKFWLKISSHVWEICIFVLMIRLENWKTILRENFKHFMTSLWKDDRLDYPLD